MSVQQAWTRSSRCFDSLVRPHLERFLRGQFGIVERITRAPAVGSDDWMAHQLDVLAGIDVWYMHEQRGIRGIANRVQFGDRSFDTFTVRKSRDNGALTEYEKRSRAMASGWLYPYYWLHAYCTDGEPEELLGFALARTRDLFGAIADGHGATRHTGPEQQGQAEFYYVRWQTMRSLGLWLYQWPRPGFSHPRPPVAHPDVEAVGDLGTAGSTED